MEAELAKQQAALELQHRLDQETQAELRLNKLKATVTGSGDDIEGYEADFIQNGHAYTLDELQLRIENLTPLLKTMTDSYHPIYALANEENQQELKAKFEEVKASYFKTLSNMKSAVRTLTAADAPLPPPETKSSVKCPTITLPDFDGNPENWLRYREMFESIVHKNAKLSDIEKFHYLQTTVKLPSSQCNILDNFVMLGENYEEAWKALCKRYNDKRKILAHHVNTMMSVKKMSTENATELRRVIDAYESTIQSLKHMGYILADADDFANLMIVNILLSRLDEITLREWKKHCIEDTCSYEKLNDFLVSYWRSLDDTIPIKKTSFKPNEQKPTMTAGKPGSKSHTISASDGAKCQLCCEPHLMWHCKLFQKMTVSERFSIVKSNRLCYNCFSPLHQTKQCTHTGRCKKCQGQHHTMVHLEKQQQSPIASSSSQSPHHPSGMSPNVPEFKPFPATKASKNDQTSMVAMQKSFIIKRKSLLSTALVGVRDADGRIHLRRALLDSGSDCNFITSQCAKEIGLPMKTHHSTLTGIGEKSTVSKYHTSAIVTSRYGLYENDLSFLVLDQLTGCLPSQDVNVKSLAIPSDYFLADPHFFKAANVDMILMDEIFYGSMLNATHKIEFGPWMIHTKFGWVIGGSVLQDTQASSNASSSSSYLSCFSMKSFHSSEDIDKKLEKFFTMEDVDSPRVLSAEEKYCEDLYASTTTRGHDGRYQVFMPMKSNLDQLGMNLNSTLRQFYSEENSRMKDEQKQRLTINYIDEYLQANIMHQVQPPMNNQICYYMPQHGVMKMTSSTTKLRRVSNASSKSETGLSLNDVMCVGPVVQPDMLDILIRSREYKFIFSGDISRMYLQIWINESQRKFLRVLWRNDKSEPIKHYEMCTVTFGTASAQFLATRTVVQIANDNEKKFPEAARIVKDSVYVDDLLFGTNNIDHGLIIRDQIREMFSDAGMHLRKMTSNSQKLLSGLSPTDIEEAPNDDKMIRTLGITLDAKNDCYVYRLKFKKEENIVTKASVLSCIASIFDPTGWVGPVILTLKLFMKKLWLSLLDWNDPLPDDLHDDWMTLKNSLSFLDDVRINRHCLIENHQSIELHSFADASEQAYGAAVFLRSIDSEGRIQTSLICGKLKVAPKNQKTLARLELCAAVLCAKLTKRILSILHSKIDKVTLWSDSTIVLSWIKMSPATLSTFVGNRVAVIQELTSSFVWKHIRTNENPADVISRGLYAQDIITSTLWWYGPKFFAQPQSTWPESILTISDDDNLDFELRKEVKKSMKVTKSTSMFEYIDTRFSRPTVLINVFALIRRFIYNCRRRQEKRISGPIQLEEQESAEHYVIKVIQMNLFPHEYQILLKQNAFKEIPIEDRIGIPPHIDEKSSLIALSPFIDRDGVMRVRGRLDNSPELTYNQKHPMILPQCHFSTTIIRFFHRKYLHPGQQAMFSFVRQKYWIIRARFIIKKVNFECIRCFKVKPRDNYQLMADLPAARVTIKPPFTSTAIDYAGAYSMKSGYLRNSPLHKCYIALFKCMCTGAIHLELVSDLTTEAFLAALSRFTSRRGLCNEIYSDNATYFEGASNEIKKLMKEIDPIVRQHCQDEGIVWKFTTPRASHAGGIYESGIKSMKHHLKRLLDDTPLNFEQFTTVLHKIESILNSRPITPMTTDPDDLRALTPGHFLVGRPLIAKPERNFIEMNVNRLTVWQRSQKLSQMFWQEWNKDYITTMQQRPKNFRHEFMYKVGDMVIVKESNLPPLKWMLGRITRLFPGKDNIVRNVEIITSTGHKQRHVKYLCLLPIEENSHSSRNAE